MDIKLLWKKCLDEIEIGISKANFSTWFKNTSILKEEMGVVYGEVRQMNLLEIGLKINITN